MFTDTPMPQQHAQTFGMVDRKPTMISITRVLLAHAELLAHYHQLSGDLF